MTDKQLINSIVYCIPSESFIFIAMGCYDIKGHWKRKKLEKLERPELWNILQLLMTMGVTYDGTLMKRAKIV